MLNLVGSPRQEVREDVDRQADIAPHAWPVSDNPDIESYAESPEDYSAPGEAQRK